MMNTFSTSRLEAFSDGVIAVIITIMVLELKVPALNGPEGLRSVLPSLAVYALSYTFVGIYWINHHLLLDRVEKSTSAILRSNLLWLFCLSLLPFFTAYVHQKSQDAFSVALYSVSLLVTGFSFMLLRVCVNVRQREEGHLEPEDLAMQSKHWISLGSYCIAIPLAYFAPTLSLCSMALVTLLWLVPDFGARHLSKRFIRGTGN